MPETLEIGLCKHEVAVFLNGSIQEVFRTDLEECKPTILAEAKRRLEYLQKEHPDRVYTMGDVPAGLKIRNAGLVYQ
jgi:hypothetical protein